MLDRCCTSFISCPALGLSQCRDVRRGLLAQRSNRARVAAPVATAYRLRPSSVSRMIPLFPLRAQVTHKDNKRSASEVMDSVGMSVMTAGLTWLMSLPLIPVLALTWPLLAPFIRVMVRNARFRLSLRNGTARLVTGDAWVDRVSRMVLLDDGRLLLRLPASSSVMGKNHDGESGNQEVDDAVLPTERVAACALLVGVRVLAIVALEQKGPAQDQTSVFAASPMVDVAELRRVCRRAQDQFS